MNYKYKLLPIAIGAALLAGCTTKPVHDRANVVDVRVLGLNDFHGALKAPGSNQPGGIEHMSTLIKELKKENPNNIVVAAGDMIGASPLLSSMFHDEPSIEALSLAGLEATSVGNHEFDKGKEELLRKQNGGCHPVTGCQGPTPFKGADFQYLSANVTVNETGKTLFPEYVIKEFEGIPVAFIGLTLEGTPAIVTPQGTAGLSFANEVKTINALVPELQKKGVKAIGVLIHEGAAQKRDGERIDVNACNDVTGKVLEVVNHLDKEVDFVISGHTHQAYNCVINGKSVTSAQSNGALITKLDLKLDKATKDVVNFKAENIWVDDRKYGKDPKITELLASYEKIATPLANRVIGKLESNLTKQLTQGGESSLGKVIADAHLYSTTAKKDGGAQIAFVNNGGIRAPMDAGDVTYNAIYTVQPFSNMMVTKTLTGEQIKRLLEQQWDRTRPQILAVSHSFQYSWDSRRPVGDRVMVNSMKINGKPVDLQTKYRVAANEYLATGGSSFSVFKEGTDPVYNVPDIDAVVKYFTEKSPIYYPKQDRIIDLGAK
ncbi:bifunctional metallophosphatase/5'-nucleotidase [Xenorhabdus hominickii]|uniref:Adenosine synthase A n=1 Tax=Xenorhabdus hominickii TaxID=351679 RepID=A0A2G0Q8K6_XENHO|nr:bifunctional metallophosphatase/5'-nucleotidase [Xenorhabdus hominickii]AOM41195.1 bifunctional metallophosphatase/5'-nucleotidase [Xenorhabdus hominickii]PHM55558.1 Adenosine synthase A [Xenorhabdus hominickii]PHM57078.1 Adenosine synthase A [Xenorhabdus hominickii]